MQPFVDDRIARANVLRLAAGQALAGAVRWVLFPPVLFALLALAATGAYQRRPVLPDGVGPLPERTK
jgi:hypothetical protein